MGNEKHSKAKIKIQGKQTPSFYKKNEKNIIKYFLS
jgi:hypothetical protein